MTTFREIFAALCAATLVLASHLGTAHAATLQVSPILVQFYQGTQAQPIWLSNEGDRPMRAQVRVNKWTQTEDGDALEVTNELVASPPVMEIGAGKRQLLRIVRRHLASAAEEEGFRIIVDELPDTETASADNSSALNFLLRYSIPVFISPAAGPPKTLEHQAQGQLLLSPPRMQITNGGKSRIRAARLVHEGKDGQTTQVLEGLIGYVLANKQRTWELPPSVASLPPGIFKLKIANDAGEHILQMELPQK